MRPMTAFAIVIGLGFVLAFVAYVLWLKRQDFSGEIESIEKRLAESARVAADGTLRELASKVEGIAHRVGTLEAFAGLERKD